MTRLIAFLVLITVFSCTPESEEDLITEPQVFVTIVDICEDENLDLFTGPWTKTDSSLIFQLYSNGTTDPHVATPPGGDTILLPSSWEYLGDPGCYCEHMRWYINNLSTPDSTSQVFTIIKLTPDSLVTYSPLYNSVNTFIR